MIFGFDRPRPRPRPCPRERNFACAFAFCSASLQLASVGAPLLSALEAMWEREKQGNLESLARQALAVYIMLFQHSFDRNQYFSTHCFQSS